MNQIKSIEKIPNFNKFAVNWECGCRSVHDAFLESEKEYCPNSGQECKRCGCNENCEKEGDSSAD